MSGFFKSKIAKVFYAVIGLVIVGFVAFLLYLNLALVNVGETARNWNLQTPAGDSVVFYETSGNKPSVLIFWATSCPYCQALMPVLADLQATLPTGIANFYALNIFEDGDPVAFFADHEYEFELLLNADEIADEYGVFATPGIMLIDVDNTVLYSRLGTGSPDAIAEDLRTILLEKSP